GNTRPDGVYSIEITGTNLAGNAVKISTQSIGIVTAVDFSGSEPMLTVGKNKVALKDVTDVRLVSDTGSGGAPPRPAAQRRRKPLSCIKDVCPSLMQSLGTALVS